MPMISVIVCTYNRAQTLRRMLEGFFSQQDLDRLKHELIVVDNNSTDDTPQVAKKFSNKPGFFYVLESRQGLSFARNRGIAEAAGDFVSFLDDDVIVDSRWLASLQKCLDETHADAVGGKVDLNFQAPPPAWLGPLFRMHLAELDLDPTRLVGLDRYGYSGCNVTFRKQALQDIGGFDVTLGRIGTQLRCYEETVVLYRIQSAGGKLVYDAAVRVEHLVGPERMIWPYFKRLVVSQGISLSMLEIDGAVMSRLIALISKLGLGRIFKDFLDSHRKPTRTLLVERHPPTLKWLKLILVDLAFLVTAIFKIAVTYVSLGDSYKRKAGQASVLTAASLVLHRWKNLWNSI
ncbi:MAG: glycosyltransferase [Pseudomonadota bacterium]